MMRRQGLVAGLTVGAAAMLSGCGTLPAPDSVTLAPPPGLSLPLKARTMIYMSETDLGRNLVVHVNARQTEETKVREGEANARAAKVVLRKAFQTVETNDPAVRPQLVVKLSGKASWAPMDGKLKVTCMLDAYTADGIPIGSFPARFDSPNGVDYATSLEGGYGQCVRNAAGDLLRAPALARFAAAGFPDPDPSAVAAWFRSLGVIPGQR
jgi:hypothetical protein